MQRLATEYSLAFLCRPQGLPPTPIDGIGEEREAGFGEMDANLMGPAGVERDLHPRGAIEALERSQLRERGLARCDLPGEALPVFGMPAKERLNPQRIRRRPMHQREVSLGHRAVLE